LVLLFKGGWLGKAGRKTARSFALAGAALPRQQVGGHRIKSLVLRFLRHTLQRVVCAARPFTHNADYAAKRTVGPPHFLRWDNGA